ncbi:site-2 protease family protein [bacterium]|nr:site-2 protease family protein [bacterium]
MTYIFLLIVLVFSVIIHEIAHGAVAYYLGDPTAKYAGRLTLNPIPHIDPFGSILIPLLLVLARSPIVFGWAKPVPINPYNFRDQKYGQAKVALAGPAANLAIALVFGLILRFLPLSSQFSFFAFALSYIVFINILLAVFNLIPIPPLDGSHILFTFLPDSFIKLKMFLGQYGFFILLIVIFFFLQWLYPLIEAIYTLIVGSPL